MGEPISAPASPSIAHLKNPLGEANELGVEARGAWPGQAVLDELREVSGERTVQLGALTVDDLQQPVDTPAGPGTLADMLTLRVMDTWSHEQDIRRALGRPGHGRGPAVDESVAYWLGFLPYAVGKRAEAPDGATVTVQVDDHRRIVEVVAGRARLTDSIDGPPTTGLAASSTTFAALVGGRTDAPEDATITGDAELGQRVVAGLGFLP